VLAPAIAAPSRELPVPHVVVGDENNADISIYYEDHGSGRPVVLIHGFPLNGHSWEKQEATLLGEGYRVITYDRRGFGASSRPSNGYDYDTLARDLEILLAHLRIKDAVLVGFAMGGGEVARYLCAYGPARIGKAAFISSITPHLLRTPDNPEGLNREVFEEMIDAIRVDRLTFLTAFLGDYYNLDLYGGNRVSPEIVRLGWDIAAHASQRASTEVVAAWMTDFRSDLAKIDIPTLIVHGTTDRILPIEATGDRLHQMLPGSQYAVIEGGPHGLLWTHPKEVDAALLAFLAT
jgi:pimeloyl-ACP methyl ester carboxylesterase